MPTMDKKENKTKKQDKNLKKEREKENPLGPAPKEAEPQGISLVRE
ncbi:hypothetical protein [Evtepia gabavorous]